MRLNEMICPTCGHRCFTNCAYVTCDACGTFYYASQSAGCKLPPSGVTVYPVSTIQFGTVEHQGRETYLDEAWQVMFR